MEGEDLDCAYVCAEGEEFGEDTEAVEVAEGCGGEIDGTANGGGFWARFVEREGVVLLVGALEEGEREGEAGGTGTEDEDVHGERLWCGYLSMKHSGIDAQGRVAASVLVKYMGCGERSSLMIFQLFRADPALELPHSTEWSSEITRDHFWSLALSPVYTIDGLKECPVYPKAIEAGSVERQDD